MCIVGHGCVQGEMNQFAKTLKLMPTWVSREAMAAIFKIASIADAGSVEGADMARLASMPEFKEMLVRIGLHGFSRVTVSDEGNRPVTEAEAVSLLLAHLHQAATGNSLFKHDASAAWAAAALKPPSGSAPLSVSAALFRDLASVSPAPAKPKAAAAMGHHPGSKARPSSAPLAPAPAPAPAGSAEPAAAALAFLNHPAASHAAPSEVLSEAVRRALSADPSLHATLAASLTAALAQPRTVRPASKGAGNAAAAAVGRAASPSRTVPAATFFAQHYALPLGGKKSRKESVAPGASRSQPASRATSAARPPANGGAGVKKKKKSAANAK